MPLATEEWVTLVYHQVILSLNAGGREERFIEIAQNLISISQEFCLDWEIVRDVYEVGLISEVNVLKQSKLR